MEIIKLMSVNAKRTNTELKVLQSDKENKY